MSRLKGEINSEEKQALEAKIVDLKKTLDERKSTLSLLEAQIKKLHVTHLSYTVSCPFPYPEEGSHTPCGLRLIPCTHSGCLRIHSVLSEWPVLHLSI